MHTKIIYFMDSKGLKMNTGINGSVWNNGSGNQYIDINLKGSDETNNTLEEVKDKPTGITYHKILFFYRLFYILGILTFLYLIFIPLKFLGSTPLLRGLGDILQTFSRQHLPFDIYNWPSDNLLDLLIRMPLLAFIIAIMRLLSSYKDVTEFGKVIFPFWIDWPIIRKYSYAHVGKRGVLHKVRYSGMCPGCDNGNQLFFKNIIENNKIKTPAAICKAEPKDHIYRFKKGGFGSPYNK